MKLNREEEEIVDLYEQGKIPLNRPSDTLLNQLKLVSESTFKKDRRIHIRLSDRDMAGIQSITASKGIPYQSLISGLIHQFVEGDLVEKK